MKIKDLQITGYAEMVRSIFISNKHYNDEIADRITNGEKVRNRLMSASLSEDSPHLILSYNDEEDYEWYRKKIETAIKLSCGSLYEKASSDGAVTPEQVQLCHSTIGRFLDISCVVDGLHRGATDDFDAHAKRLDSRIIRRSTRTTSPDDIELSDWYKDKIIPFGDLDGKTVGAQDDGDTDSHDFTIKLPDTIFIDGIAYKKTRFGYVLYEYKDDYDVLRGLTPLGMSNLFIFKCNVTEWAHITRLRKPGTHASPELQQLIKMINDEIEKHEPLLNDNFWRYCLQ